MKDTASLITHWWIEQPKPKNLNTAIQILSSEIYAGPGVYFGPDVNALQCQVNIARWIERAMPELPGQLLFDDCGQVITKDNGEPMSNDEYYESVAEDDYKWMLEQELNETEPEYSRYWNAVDSEPMDCEPKHKRQDTTTGQWYEFDESAFDYWFNNYYEPSFDFVTLVDGNDIANAILGHALELVRL